MNIENIKPFIEASQTVLKKIADIDVKIGKVYLKDSPYRSGSVLVFVGLTGEMLGQTIFTMEINVALSIASCMMNAELSELDEMSISAICELTNMIIGNAATILYKKGMRVAITPPSFVMGDNMQVSPNKAKTICIPLLFSNGGGMEIDISLLEL
jgi:chemotaxis protein CheX